MLWIYTNFNQTSSESVGCNLGWGNEPILDYLEKLELVKSDLNIITINADHIKAIFFFSYFKFNMIDFFYVGSIIKTTVNAIISVKTLR